MLLLSSDVYGDKLRKMYTWLIFMLPAGGLLIVATYKLMHYEKDIGTNLVISSIHSGDHIPLRMAPLISISTVITHFFGDSAGGEGAAIGRKSWQQYRKSAAAR